MKKLSTKSSLNKKYWVVKRNELNELRPQDLKLQELRFFSIYLSKINPRDLSTRVVRFPVADFQAIMELGRLNMAHLKNATTGLLTKVVGIPDEKGTGLIQFQLFKESRIIECDDGEWYVEIDAHDRALPLMFDFKSHYFKYELWNALGLKSHNQLRMYEILKQYEKTGYKIMRVEELKWLLGVMEGEYPRFGDFKNRVLNSCQKALSEHTDISYTYEPHGKKGRGGKILELKFTITKNKGFKSPLALEKFIELGNQSTVGSENDTQESDGNDTFIPITDGQRKLEDRLILLREACNNEFTREQIVVLYDNMPDWTKHDCFRCQEFLALKYREMEMRRPSQSRFGYLKKILAVDNTADGDDYIYGAK